MFRLDENRLKPDGSKVRCSQCGHIFIAFPPAPVDAGGAPEAAPTVAPALSAAAVDRELEGIDLAELDSILENDRGAESAHADSELEADEPVAEFNEADLDFDFESALDIDEAPEPEPVAETADPAVDELDLDMDFELDAGDSAEAEGHPAEDAVPESTPLEVEGDSLELTPDDLQPS